MDGPASSAIAPELSSAVDPPQSDIPARPTTPQRSTQTTPATTPTKTGKRQTKRREPARKGELLQDVRSALERWRISARARDYPYSALTAKSLLPDQTLSKLATNNMILTPSDLATLDPPWIYRNKYGAEVLALLSSVVDAYLARRDSKKIARAAVKAQDIQVKNRLEDEVRKAGRARNNAAEKERVRIEKERQAQEAKRRADEENEAKKRAAAEKEAKKALYAANYAARRATIKQTDTPPSQSHFAFSYPLSSSPSSSTFTSSYPLFSSPSSSTSAVGTPNYTDWPRTPLMPSTLR